MSRSIPGFLSSSRADQGWSMGPLAEAAQGLAGQIAGYDGADFNAFCARMFWDAARRHDLPEDGAESVLLHAVLVGLARGASRDAYLHATTRQIQGRPLIDHELASWRLSVIAVAETICDVQLANITQSRKEDCAPTRDEAGREIRRASGMAIAEAAHVHGGQGYVGDSAPRRRIEVGNAVLTRARLTGKAGEWRGWERC